MNTRFLTVTVISISAMGFALTGTAAPTSSLSPDAFTPRANQNGATLPSVIEAFVQSVRGQTPAPANAGPLNPEEKN